MSVSCITLFDRQMKSHKSLLTAKEICKETLTPELHEEVASIVEEIYMRDIPIILYKLAPQSGATWNTVKKIPEHLTIQIQPGLAMIWDLLHEFGHILDGYKPDINQLPPQEQYDREKRAWGNGKMELLKYPLLFAMIENYDAYTEKCLATYRHMFKKQCGVEVV